MEKFDLRMRIALEKWIGHLIIPSVIKALHAKSKGLKMKVVRRSDVGAEITTVDKENREWRYLVDIAKETCSCRQWQVKGLPCIHALYFITSLRGPVSEIEPYVHEFYSVAKFKAAYVDNIPAMVGKQQWDIVDPGFKLQAPVLRRPKG